MQQNAIRVVESYLSCHGNRHNTEQCPCLRFVQVLAYDRQHSSPYGKTSLRNKSIQTSSVVYLPVERQDISATERRYPAVVPVSSAINEVKAYLAIHELKEPSGRVSPYRHASAQAFQGGRKATAAKVHPLCFDALQLFYLLLLQPPVDGGVLKAYSPCRFVAFHAFGYQSFVPV